MNYKEEKISNWANYPKVDAKVYETQFYSEVKKLVKENKSIIAKGNGRSYGDASLGETVFSTLKLNKFISLDTKNGILECQSGVLLSDILSLIVAKSWFLSVTPGTKYITIGGAIGADVHGKNHHSEGSFCDYVYEFTLLDADANIIKVNKENNEKLFWETCGGMGNTGIILSAKIQLKKIETSYINQKKIVTKNIFETIEAFDKYSNYPYSVAWVDCLSKGDKLGRSIITFGDFAKLNELPTKLKTNPLKNSNEDKKINIPFNFPDFALKNWSVKLFNFLYYNKEFKKESDSFVHFDSFFYPLDALLNWNRIYGKKGFVQYQFVLPLEKDNITLIEVFKKIVNNGEGSFLTVLKLLGKANKSKMGFPMSGYTIALDFKVSKKIFKFLDELDEIIIKAGGKIYLAKDARMKASTFQFFYKEDIKETKFLSRQLKRLRKNNEK